MEESSYNKILVNLSTARKLKKNWYLVAFLTESLKGNDIGPKQQAERMKDAADASGYSINTLNRMLGVKLFFELVKERDPHVVDIDPNTVSFPSLEVVKRWHQLDPDKAIIILNEVISGRITYRKLREKYNMSVVNNAGDASAHQVARLKAKGFEEAALDCVKHSLNQLFVDQTINMQSPEWYPIAIDALFYRMDLKEPIAALELVHIRDEFTARNNFVGLMHRLIFHAAFFDRYWIVFASTIGEDRIKCFCRLLDELDRASIGVVIMPWGDEVNISTGSRHLKIERRPTGNPIPDWRSKLFQYGKIKRILAS